MPLLNNSAAATPSLSNTIATMPSLSNTTAAMPSLSNTVATTPLLNNSVAATPSLSNSVTTTTSQCYELQRHCCDLGSFDVRLSFVRLSSDDSFRFRLSNFRPSRDFRPTFVAFLSCALRPVILRPAVLSHAPYHHAYHFAVLPFHPTFV